MIIRPATPTDIPKIKDIWNHYIRTSTITFKSIEKTDADVASSIKGNPVFIVAGEDQPIGFATCFQFRNGEGYIHSGEHTIMLHPDTTAKGVGHDLLIELEKQAKDAGYTSLTAGICSENETAINFHTKNGFRTCGKVSQVGRKFDRWLDLVLMQKML